MRDVVCGYLSCGPARVLVIGEGIEPCGWLEDIRRLTGPDGSCDVHEIIRDGRAAVRDKKVGRNGKIGCWRWTYTNGVRDDSYDAVAILQSAQHCDDWQEAGAGLVRVPRPGGRIVSAEMCLEGDRFQARVGADLHIRQWYDKMFPAGRAEISNYSGEELLSTVGAFVEGGQCMEWRGIELFWDRKPA